MVVAVRVGAEVILDKGAVIARCFPFVIVEVGVAVGLEARGIGSGPQRQILAAQVGCGGPGCLALLLVARHAAGDVDAPADIGHDGGFVVGLFPGRGLGVVDAVRTRVDPEADDIAHDRAVRGARGRADVAPPHQHGAGSGQELAEGRGAGIGVDLVGGVGARRCDQVHHVLDGLHPGRVVDARLHGVGIEQPGRIARMLGIGGGAVFDEVEAEPTPALERVKIAIRRAAGERIDLADKGLRRCVDLLPGLGHFGPADGAFAEIVGAVREGVAIAVDVDPVGLAVPGAHGGLEVAHKVIGIDLRLHPVGHLVEHALGGGVAFEGGAHFDDVEVNGAGRDRLLQARVVIGLGQIDPVDLGAGIGLPRLEEAAEQEVVQVLVVQAQEGQFHACEFAFGDVRLGGAQGQLADLLPIGIGGGPHADARNLQDLRADVILREGRARAGTKAKAAQGRKAADARRALQKPPAGHR